MAWMKPQTTTRPYRNLRCPRFFDRRMVEQQLVRNRPSIFRRMILVGTAPRGGEDIMHIDKPGPEFPRFSPESFPASGGPFCPRISLGAALSPFREGQSMPDSRLRTKLTLARGPWLA